MLVKIMIVASDFFENKPFIEDLRATFNRDLPEDIDVSIIGAYRINHAVNMIHHADIIIGSGLCKEHADYAVTGDEVVEYDASELAAIHSKRFISMVAAKSHPELVTSIVEEVAKTKAEH